MQDHNDRSDSHSPDPLAETGQVRPSGFSQFHLQCSRCGYDLSGTPANALCPECSFPVLNSVPRPLTDVGAYRSLVWMKSGCSLVICSFVIFGITSFLSVFLPLVNSRKSVSFTPGDITDLLDFFSKVGPAAAFFTLLSALLASAGYICIGRAISISNSLVRSMVFLISAAQLKLALIPLGIFFVQRLFIRDRSSPYDFFSVNPNSLADCALVLGLVPVLLLSGARLLFVGSLLADLAATSPSVALRAVTVRAKLIFPIVFLAGIVALAFSPPIGMFVVLSFYLVYAVLFVWLTPHLWSSQRV